MHRHVVALAALTLGLLLGLPLAGCGGWGAYTIERTVGGEQRLGSFVAPHSYENFVLGELARERGAWAEAAQHYELARSGAEDDPLLIARLADVQDRQGDRVAAERTLAEGDRLDPESEAIAMIRGELAERHGESDAAITAYARAAALGEGDDAPVLALARVLRERGAAERADAVLEEWLEARPDGVGAARARLALALAQGDSRTAGLAALDLARISPAYAGEVAETARAVLEGGHPLLAHRILVLLPESAVPPTLRLEVAIAAGALGEAEAILATWAPDEPREIVVAGRAWLALGDADRAAMLAEVALAQGAGIDARLVLGRARLEQGRIADAVELAAEVPAGSSGWVEAQALIVDALGYAGMPALAAEVRANAH